MGSIGLPDKDSADIYLVVATRDELLTQQQANSDEWRGVLPAEAYVRRETYLYSQELTRDGGMTPWVLVHQPDPKGPRQILCGCESIRKRALVARDGQIEDVISHGVCSVFCSPDKRGRGYAGRMMKEMAQRMEHWQLDNGKSSPFSILYSDIGKDFYALRGWQAFPSAHVSVPALATTTPADVRLLKNEDIAELCALDEKLVRQKLYKLKTSNRTTVAIVPDHATIAWHHARDDFVANELYGKTPSVKGIMVGDRPGSRIWMYFTRVWTYLQEDCPNTLHILRLVIEDESLLDFSPASSADADKLEGTDVVRAIAACLQVAQSEAALWDMKDVTIWNPTSATLAAARSLDPKAAVVEREHESIASLNWYGSGSVTDIDWVCNEKYGWC
ncbi:hypothetical protein PRZ48_014418 [Zasmidium cellare]|uniref:LYC1 C-terminal domain-containing protein n=1 Tax=Zasmidium cellare TaxID=395010 RepID=A0ABR0DYA3_ZASCE|nr:hypothetical protein PRZ48_014418 [Zasmidium cellare]